MIEGSFNALAAGTFVYVAILYVIDSEMYRSDDHVAHYVRSSLLGDDDAPLPAQDTDRIFKFILMFRRPGEHGGTGVMGLGAGNVTMDSRDDAGSGQSHGRPRVCSHARAHDLRSAGKRNLVIALALIAGFMLVEIIGGILSGSLALLADAGHMLADAASIALALLAMHFAERPHSAQRTFGYHRLEILAALANALVLWVIASWILFESCGRFKTAPEVDGEIMLSIGAVGLCVNLIAAWVLHRFVRSQPQYPGRISARARGTCWGRSASSFPAS